MINFIKKLLYNERPNLDSEIWTDLDEIIIPYTFEKSGIGKIKYERKKNFYLNNNFFESPIILDKDFILRNGYTSYMIAKEFGMKQVPVYFLH